MLVLPSDLSGFHFPFGDFQHSVACNRGCGVMVDGKSDVYNCLSIVDFEVYIVSVTCYLVYGFFFLQNTLALYVWWFMFTDLVCKYS